VQLVGQALVGEAVGEGALVHAGSRRLVGAAAGPEGAQVATLYRSDFRRLQEQGARDVSASSQQAAWPPSHGHSLPCDAQCSCRA
jgi:hypothetical protein